jgi:hypothetical protein
MATLIHHWDFSAGSGTTLYDKVGTNHGTLRYSTAGLVGAGPATNGPTWVSGVDGVGNALRFADAKANFVSTTTPYSNPRTLTFSTFFRTSIACGQKIFGFESSQTGVSLQYDRILFVGTDGKLKYGHWSGGARLVTSTAFVNDSLWHQGAITIDANNVYILYLDGLPQMALQYAPESYNGYWRIGGSNFTAYGGCWTYADCAGGFGAFDGDITDIRVYDGVASAEEIQDVYEAMRYREFWTENDKTAEYPKIYEYS